MIVFSSIFKGTHVRHREMVSVLTGRDITVRFDQPTPLQIDGETFPDALEYHVTRPEENERIKSHNTYRLRLFGAPGGI